MGITHLESFMEGNPLISTRIDIRKLILGNEKKVIVVDGDEFVTSYVFKHFLWIIGSVTEFEENVRDFVKAFQDLNVKLVFFFHKQELDKQNANSWMKNRKAGLQRARIIFEEVKEQKSVVNLCIAPENDVLRPFDVNFWTISVLREMECEVICSFTDPVFNMALYAQENDCLAIMTQNIYFIYFPNVSSSFLSVKHFDVERMTTKTYNTEALISRLQIDKKFSPLLAALVVTSEELASPYRNVMVQEILRRVSQAHSVPCFLVAVYIRENYDPLKIKYIPTLLSKHFPECKETLIKKYSEFEVLFNLKLEDSPNMIVNCYVPDESALCNWEKLIMKCQELHKCGKLNDRIFSVVVKQIYEEYTSIEDFLNFPQNSRVYKNLRQNMYGILLHEKMYHMKNLKVLEWCLVEEYSQECPIAVLPSPIDSNIHPGLLKLWDSSIVNEDLMDKKWRLFAAAVSPTLNHHILRSLPESLVAPVAVLYYLYREVPRILNTTLLKFWEIEVFLVVTLTLPLCNHDFLKKLSVLKNNERVLRLVTLFIHGCDVMRTVAQACGFGVDESYLCIWHYFDGKLFNYLYEKAEAGATIIEKNSEIYEDFDIIRKHFFHPQQCSLSFIEFIKKLVVLK